MEKQMKLKSDRFHLENVIARMSCLHTVYSISMQLFKAERLLFQVFINRFFL